MHSDAFDVIPYEVSKFTVTFIATYSARNRRISKVTGRSSVLGRLETCIKVRGYTTNMPDRFDGVVLQDPTLA